ncbi:rRNA processing/ribosome biogenesis-domain-containing protein [Trametes elegans]|nr:rRNA processing/ribosome biogenesis-domain-containing protein [Trametes elegans]
MDSSHRLRDLLQLQLASDAYAVLHLPFVLESLSKEDFLPSAHTQKWIARVNSLIHSKDPGAKWSGLCLAFQTAVYSRSLMLECAQSWVAASLPLLVNQPVPTTKAAIRLLRLVFSNAMDVPEFQRQLCVPNVPKFGNGLITIAEKETNADVNLLVVDTLVHIVSLYPSLCRPLHAALSNVALRHLNGSAPNPSPGAMVEACSRLYSVLPLTGGKVGAAGLWRKSVDDTIAFAWGALLQLRTTYPQQAYVNVANPGPLAEDPVVGVPLALDRLRAGVRVLGDLLRATTSRPVSLPVGSLARLCLALLQCQREEKSDAAVDPMMRSLEEAVIPTIWTLACDLLVPLSQACNHHLAPHLSVFLSYMAYRIEQSQSAMHTVRFLRTTLSLLGDGCRLHDNTLSSRLARAVMPLLTVILSKRSQTDVEGDQGGALGRNKKGKKRARGYEGDEVFKVGREIVCPTPEEGEILLLAVDVLEALLLRTQVNASVQSLASRLLLAIYSSLPQLPPGILSPDLSLHPRLYFKLQLVCSHLAIGTTSTMGKALGLVLSVSDGIFGENVSYLSYTNINSVIDLLLHPRVPPLVRSLPHIEMLSLFRAEESQEEADARTSIGIAVMEERAPGRSDSDVPESLTPQDQNSTPMQVDVVQPKRSTIAKTTIAEPAMQPVFPEVAEHHPAVGTIHQPLQVLQSSPPPPPDPLPSRTVALGSQPATTAIPPVTSAAPASSLAQDDDDDDEPMPTIDLGSDSDSD